jgi:hypothetical protein
MNAKVYSYVYISNYFGKNLFSGIISCAAEKQVFIVFFWHSGLICRLEDKFKYIDVVIFARHGESARARKAGPGSCA